MMKNMMILTLAALAVSCADEEEPTFSPEARCAGASLGLVGEGSLERADGAVGAVVLESKAAAGEIRTTQLLLRLGGYNSGEGARPLLVRISGGGAGDLITRIDRGDISGPLNVLDATEIPAGNVSATALDRYPCNMESGMVCVQVGEDSNGNGLLDDQDVRVFNASGGTVTLDALDTSKKRLRLRYNVTLGRNIIDVRSMTQGTFAGCLDAGFTTLGESDWTLR
jgi:hypothetical protein